METLALNAAANAVERQARPSGPLARLPGLDSGAKQVLLSVEIFERYLGSPAGLQRLYAVLQDNTTMEAVAEAFLAATDYSALWLLLLLQLECTEEERQCVEALYESFKVCKKIPTGLRLAHSEFGHFPLSKDMLESCMDAAKDARRIFLVMIDGYCQGLQGPRSETSARLRLVLATLGPWRRCDSMERLLASRALAFVLGATVDIEQGYTVGLSGAAAHAAPASVVMLTPVERLRLARQFLELLYGSFCSALASFSATHLQLRALHKERTDKLEAESDAMHEYKLLLFEVSGYDDEETMPVSINHYLNDNDELRVLYARNEKRHGEVLGIQKRYNAELLSFLHLVPCVRFACALLVHALGLVLPATVCSGEEARSEEDDKLLEKVHDMLLQLPWGSSFQQFFQVEREIYGAVYTRMLACVAMVLFPGMQELLSKDDFAMDMDEATAYEDEKKYLYRVTRPSLVRKALNDLVNPAVAWQQSEQVFPIVEEWLEKQTLHRPVRHCRLDTRISTAVVYWAGHHNPLVQERLCAWRAHITDTSTALMWPQLLVRSDRAQEAAPFAHDDGAEPFVQREYKEYHVGLADQATFDFLMAEMRRAEEQEEVYNTQAQNMLKLCTDYRISAHYGNMFSQQFFAVLMLESPFHFEGGSMQSLRGQHPLNIVLQLSTHTCNSVASVQGVLMDTHHVHLPSLFRCIRASAKPLSTTEDPLLFNVGLQLLANVVQGPCPVHRNPAQAALFKDTLLEPVHSRAIDILREKYQQETLMLVAMAASVVFRSKPSDLCPIGVLRSPALSIVTHLLTSLCFVLQAEVVLQEISNACMATFATNMWHVATTSAYERHKMQEDEREEQEADADDANMQTRIAAKKELKRQTYANFFLFSLEGGLYALANHYIQEGGWALPKDVLAAYWAELDPVSNEYRCLALELLNVLSASVDSLLQLVAKQTNFLAGVLLDMLALVAHGGDLPQLQTLKAAPRHFERDPALVSLRVAEQAMRLCARVVDLGRVGCRVAGGRVPHSSATNEFVLYLAMADSGNALEVASGLLTYASAAAQRISLSRAQAVVQNRSGWDEYVEHSLWIKLRDTALVAVSFLHQMCTGRMELQSKVHERCPRMFEDLPRLLSQSNFLQGVELHASPLFSDNRYYHFHVGLARSIPLLLQGLCARHEGCTTIVQTSGCMEAMCSGLNDCMNASLPLEDWIMRSWSECITKTVETIVSRSIEAWQYCQDVSGVSGLFKLIALGNNTIKKLCVTTFLDHATQEQQGEAAAYIESMVAADAIVHLRVLVEIQDDDDLVNLTLTLVKLVVITSKAFRVAAFDRAQSEFFTTITKLLRRNHTEIQTNVCDIFNYFCVEDASALRSLLRSLNALNAIQNLAGASGRENNASGDETERIKIQTLAQAAATTVANLTKSDESEFLVGSAPLRPTLQLSGILPSLRK